VINPAVGGLVLQIQLSQLWVKSLRYFVGSTNPTGVANIKT